MRRSIGFSGTTGRKVDELDEVAERLDLLRSKCILRLTVEKYGGLPNDQRRRGRLL